MAIPGAQAHETQVYRGLARRAPCAGSGHFVARIPVGAGIYFWVRPMVDMNIPQDS